jgi:outer membrane biosynthesis protein TonB
MIIRPLRFEGGSAYRRLSPAFWLVAGLASVMFPTLAHAQVNIDQGKSPAEIYSADCATCHKTPRGLAAGKNSLMLSAFLREHYTASSGEAASLAAYVLGAGGAEPAPKQKPDTEHARAEEPKPGEPKAGEPKTTSHPQRASAKPEDEKRPKEQEATREDHPESPASREKPYEAPQTASREGKPEPENAAPVAHEPASSGAAPATGAVSNAAEPISPAAGSGTSPASTPAPTASATAPAEGQSAAGASVPRDHIPD